MRAAPSILIIEDNDFALDVLSQLLPALGAGHVACARSAEVALEMLRSQKFSAILADYRLGGMDGVQFIECLRAGGDQTPVLMISGTPDNAAVIRATKHPRVEFFGKPFHVAELMGAVEKLVAS